MSRTERVDLHRIAPPTDDSRSLVNIRTGCKESTSYLVLWDTMRNRLYVNMVEFVILKGKFSRQTVRLESANLCCGRLDQNKHTNCHIPMIHALLWNRTLQQGESSEVSGR